MAIRHVRWQDLPNAIKTDARGIARAGANTLNDIAFKAVKALPDHIAKDMKFRGNPRQALGWRVEKANYQTLEAAVWTNRKWFGLHDNEGSRRPTSSNFVWKGETWIFIPHKKNSGVIDTRGRIRRNVYNGLYVTPRGGIGLVHYRQRRNKKESQFIGVAVKQAQFHKDSDWEKMVEGIFDREAHRTFARFVEARIAFKKGG